MMNNMLEFWKQINDAVVAQLDIPEQKYATGLEIDEKKYALGENSPEEKYALGENSAEKKYALGENSPPDGKYATGLKLPDEKEDELEDKNPQGPLGLCASVGRGGKNQKEDVLTIQIALNKRVKAGLPENGKCDSKTLEAISKFQMLLGQFKPNGLFEPGRGSIRMLASTKKLGPPPEPPKPIAPPKLGPPVLAKAPAVWNGTQEILKTNIAELKKGVLAHYGNEYPEVVKEIDENMKKLGVIMEKLDHRLSDSLVKANAATDAAEKKAELKYAKTLLAGYIQYVKTEPMIAHVDANPFGVATELRKVLVDALNHVAKAIG
jgi:hypothetical protein